MLNDIKTSLFQIYQFIFKPITFAKYEYRLHGENKLKLLLKFSYYSYFFSFLVVLTIRVICFYFFKVPFNWTDFLNFAFVIAGGIVFGIASGIDIGIVFGIAFCIAFSIAVGVAFGIAFGIAVGVAFGISEGIAFSIAVGVAFGIAFSIAYGIFEGIAFVISEGIGGGIAYGISEGIAYGVAKGITLGITLGIAFSIAFGITFGIAFSIVEGIGGGIAYGIAVGILASISFFVFYSRVFYVFPHLIQYFRAKSSKNPFRLFKKSPVYWDEIIIYPLPFLTEFLIMLTETNRDQGIREIKFIYIERPTQRKAAFKALFEIIIKDLFKLKSIKEISDASENISLLSFECFLPKEISETLKGIDDLSKDARKYLNSSDYNRLKNLNKFESDLLGLKKRLICTKEPVRTRFLFLTEKWSQIVEKEKKKITLSTSESFKDIPNPYIFENPVKVDDFSRLFAGRNAGRKDVVDLIKSNLTSNVSQKLSLFLYGRRRVGKSSVLINLHKLLEKQYIPVYIDFQDPSYGESQSSFCYHLSTLICHSLSDRGFPCEYPPLGSFQNNPFTTFSNWLDKTEKLLEKKRKVVLVCFDEYEKIEERILNGSLTRDVLDQLRHIVQHRKYFVILISGSNELRELQLNWSDYLTNIKMIKIDYLSKADARILITNPIDDFNLNYEGGQCGETVDQIIKLTNCQPYLVQAVCFEIVNYLNSQRRKEASVEDVNLAAEKVLTSANPYFDYIWNIECTDSEKDFLYQTIENNHKEGHKKEIDSLLRKEIIEKDGNAYKFKVELMKKWIEKNEL